MSEEVKRPTVVIPQAMIGTILTNGLLGKLIILSSDRHIALTTRAGFGMIIALLFSLGDLDEVLAAPVSQLGYPVIQIYYQATGSLHGANAMTAVSLVIVIMAHLGLMAGCSRTAWAFARDRGLPASSYLARVSTRSQVPFRAIMLSVVIQVLLGLINIGSSAAFLAFVNAAAATLYITYVSTMHTFLTTSTNQSVCSDHSGNPWCSQTPTRRAYPLRVFPAGQIPQCDQRHRHRVHIVHDFLPTVASNSASKCIVDELDHRAHRECADFSCFWWLVEGRKSFVGPNIDATLNRRDT